MNWTISRLFHFSMHCPIFCTFISKMRGKKCPDPSLVFTGLIPLVIQKVSFKKLFTICQLIHAACMGTICIFVYWKTFQNNVQDLENLAWIPLVSIIVVIIMRAIGTLPVSTTLVTELYPTEIRTQSIGITDTLSFAVGGANMLLFPDIKNLIGFHGVFLLYTIMSVITASWGAFSIPETRGKSLVKVEEIYEKETSNKTNSNEC